MKVIAVDDEPVALDIISSHAAKIPFIDLKATFLSTAQALNYLQKEGVDLVFLDILMPDLSGLELAGMIKHKSQVVFTTAYPEHALKGFELAATDYLLKPINFNRFLQASELAQRRLIQDSTQDNKEVENSDCLYIKDGHDWVRIKFADLHYAKGEDNYVSLCTGHQQMLTRMTLTDLHRRLPQDQFLRIHKSYIISVAKIERIEKHQVIIGGSRIPLAKSAKDLLLGLVQRSHLDIKLNL